MSVEMSHQVHFVMASGVGVEDLDEWLGEVRASRDKTTMSTDDLTRLLSCCRWSGR